MKLKKSVLVYSYIPSKEALKRMLLFNFIDPLCISMLFDMPGRQNRDGELKVIFSRFIIVKREPFYSHIFKKYFPVH